MKNIFFFLITALLFASCKKDADNPDVPAASESCSTNSGTFEIELLGDTHELVIDNETNYTILYNWFGYEESAFVLDGKDTDGIDLNFESGIPGVLNEGESTYTDVENGIDFMDIDAGSVHLRVSTITMNVLESDLDMNEGIYKPIRASFSGIGHQDSIWSNGVPPEDTTYFSGGFCLNGAIFQ